jgi:RNA polymerase sigma-70 factor, ECF subfamily
MENHDLDERDDKNLVADYLGGQEEVLPYLISKYLKPVYRFVFSLVADGSIAEDITQDVFIKVWKKIKSYDQKHSFKTWLFSIARNTAIDYLRKKKDITFSQFENEEGENVLLDNLADETPLSEEVLVRIEDAKFFSEVLQKLPPLYREILVLHYVNDLSLEEISHTLKRPVETVKSQRRRGILHLKGLFIRNN